MQRTVSKPRVSAAPSIAPRQRPVSFLRSPQQLVEPRNLATAPNGLAPGVVRRVSVTPDGVPTPEAVCAPCDIPVAMPQPMSPVEFCRQARRVRAVHENDPIRMHQQLSQLSGTDGREASATSSRAAKGTDGPSRSSRAIRWTWTQTSRLGKTGVSLLGKLGRGLSMPAEGEQAAPTPAMEDDQPQYTLVDPEDPLPDDQGYATSSDRTFAAMVTRTLKAQHNSLLRYSQRLTLLQEAGRRGIGRFEANLIIASVQHRLSATMPVPKPRRPIRLQGVLAFILVQGMILWGFWRVLKS